MRTMAMRRLRKKFFIWERMVTARPAAVNPAAPKARGTGAISLARFLIRLFVSTLTEGAHDRLFQ
jgi:hypothetical protein